MLYNITKDTTNEYDVYDDSDSSLYFILISPHKFLIIDKDVEINVRIVRDYIVKEANVTTANPFGLTFTLKTDTTVVRTLSDVLFAFAYDRGSVTNLSELFMFITEINAEAVFTTPLFLSAQPHIFCRYGPYRNAAGVITQPADRFINSGYALKGLMPWSEIVSKRGDITAYITDPIPAADALKVGLITVKSPGVYLINGMIQFAAVTAPIQGMEIGLRVNKNPTDVQHTCKVGPLQDGGVPFTFCIFISEFDINASDSTIAKAQGEAYLQINVGYEKGSSSLNSLKFVKDDGRFCWMTVTHLG
jgi:hypothetical protein